ncbi:hypothetical protein CKO09_08130 [Chromatium weissei]|nr:hypothetical protein [Chromatium weissei]
MFHRLVMTTCMTSLLLVSIPVAVAIETVKLSPQIRAEPLTEVIPTVAINTIKPFLTQPLVTDTEQLQHAAYVVGFPDEHLIAGSNDEIYVRKIIANAPTTFQIVRSGEALRDSDTGEILGYEAQFVADAVLTHSGDPAKLRIVHAAREVAIGDRVLPSDVEEKPLTDFERHPAPAGTNGRILSVFNGVSQIGQFDVVVLNRGKRDHLALGHVFDAFIGGDSERDQVRDGSSDTNWRGESPATTEFWYGHDMERYGWQENEWPLHQRFERKNTQFIRPLERAATLMVFRTFERVSFALVLNAERAFRVGAQIAPAAP